MERLFPTLLLTLIKLLWVKIFPDLGPNSGKHLIMCSTLSVCIIPAIYCNKAVMHTLKCICATGTKTIQFCLLQLNTADAISPEYDKAINL